MAAYETKFCPKCGMAVKPDFLFCRECGQDLENVHHTVKAGKTPVPDPEDTKEETIIPEEEADQSPAVFPWGNAIPLEPEEQFIRFEEAKEFFETTKTALGATIGQKGFLILTSHRLIFAAKLGFLSKEFAAKFVLNLEDIMTVSPGRFGFNQKMVVLDKSNNHRDFVEPHLHLLISPINEAVAARKAEIERRRKQERFVISMDFTTIRDYLDKGGVVLTAVKCPQCGGAVELPKSGSLTKCGYCGTALQAQDIFERIKGLLG